MATMITSCPQCKKQIKVPDEIAGKKIKCKGCGTVFVAASTAVRPEASRPEGGGVPKPAGAAASKRVIDDDEGDGKPYGVTDLDLTPRCPHCAEEFEDEDQIICLKCGYNTETRELGKTRRVKDIDGMDYFWWLLPGVLNALLFFICLAQLINVTITHLVTDTSEFDSLQRSCYNCTGLWCGIFCIWMMYMTGKYAIKRLILNWKPPEEELH